MWIINGSSCTPGRGYTVLRNVTFDYLRDGLRDRYHVVSQLYSFDADRISLLRWSYNVQVHFSRCRLSLLEHTLTFAASTALTKGPQTF